MASDRTVKNYRRGIAGKAVLVPVAIVLGLVVYIGVAGSTGFCPSCTYVVNAVTGGGESVALVNRNEPQVATDAMSNGPASNLVFTDLEGKSVPLKQYVGRPIVLDVWATWCAPCRASRAKLRGIAQQASEYGTMLAVSVDQGGASVVKKYIATKEGGKSPFTEVMATDPQFRSVLAPHDRRPTIPKLVFIDAQGNIVDIEYGVPNPDWVLERMRSMSTAGTKG